MMNITVDDRRRPLTGIEKLQLIQRINRENDPQRRVDAIVLATQICMKESQQAKVDDIVAKTKFALEIYQRESAQARVDRLVEDEKLAASMKGESFISHEFSRYVDRYAANKHFYDHIVYKKTKS